MYPGINFLCTPTIVETHHELPIRSRSITEFSFYDENIAIHFKLAFS
jgi:hypothetical protein